MRKIEEQSKHSQSGSVPIENESNSGNYVPSLVEKARNMQTNDRGGALGGTQKTSVAGESSSLANEDLKNAGLTQLLSGADSPSGNRNSRKRSPQKREAIDDYEDDYIDDEFDVEEEEESGSAHQASSLQPINNLKQFEMGSHPLNKKDSKDNFRSGGPPSQSELDFNISYSQSLLPPLAGGKRGDAEALMSAYNVNLAESASFDMQLSGSMGVPADGGGQSNQRESRRMTQAHGAHKRMRDNSLGDGTESMNSSDFAVSQSKASHAASSAFASLDQKAQKQSKSKHRSNTAVPQPQAARSGGNGLYQADFSRFSNIQTTG